MRDQPLHHGWRDYRFRFRMFLLVFASYLPGMWLVCQFIEEMLPVVMPFFPVIALAWMGAFGIAGVYLIQFPCPSCRQTFFLGKNPLFSMGFGQLFFRNCRHCGLRKWANPDREAKPDDKSRSQL